MDELPKGSRGLEEAAACGADGEVLQGLIEEARATSRDDRAHFRLALLYPAFVCGLALLGILWTTLTNDRLMQRVDDSFLEPPIPVPRSLPFGLGPLDVCLAAAALIAAAGLTLWIVRLGRQSGRNAATAAQCDVLAELTSCDCPPATSDRLARGIVADLDPTLASSTPALVSFAQSPGDIDERTALLRATAGFYRSLDDRHRRSVRRLVPVVGSLIAGIAVLCYGLALFRPLTSLFESLAAAHTPIGHRGQP
jgi:hypothetical protein